jgi:hypothetical protein
MAGAPKLYIIARADLTPAQQAVQGMHALQEFNRLHSETVREWYETSNHLCFLSVPSEGALESLLASTQARGLAVVAFREPDLEDSLTAIAIEPSAKRLLSGLPLALKV